MVSNLLESSALVQVVQVVQGCGVPAVPAGGTGSYVIGPVPTYRPTPAIGRCTSRRCTTSTKGRTRQTTGDWPPREFMLPADVAVIEIGRPQGERIEDHSREGRLRRLMKQRGELVEGNDGGRQP